MSIRTIQIPLALPDDPLTRKRCVKDVQDRLATKPGVRKAQIATNGEPGQTPRTDQIQINYDPDLISLAQIKRVLQQLGATPDESIAHLILPVTGLLSARTEQTAQAVLNQVPGVNASASFVSQTIRVEFDRNQCALPELVRRLDRLGIRVRPATQPVEQDTAAATPTSTNIDHPAPAISCCGTDNARWADSINSWRSAFRQPDLVLALVGGFCLIVGWVMHRQGGNPQIWGTLLAVSYLCCGWYTALDLIGTLRRFRLDIDVLMFAAAFGAASLGHYEEGALLLLLFSLGGAGQRLAMSRARGAIRALARLAPETATVIDPDTGPREVHVNDLKIGDLIRVVAGERLPADGQVDQGDSAVDQSPITGESVPVDKTIGDEVFAGTINGQGRLTVRVTKPASENTLARVIRLVEEAQTTKSPTQLFTDQVERWYVPGVLVATGILIVVPPLVGVEPVREQSLWAGWFYQAMAFLTAASPCALAIGTPAAVLSGIARAARAGVLVKGGVHLENLGRVSAIAFDKTGTLTMGRFQVTDVVSLDAAYSESNLLTLAAALESGSRHPLARAITDQAQARQCPTTDATDVEQITGMGIRGWVDGKQVTLGRAAMFSSHQSAHPDGNGWDNATRTVEQLESHGKTTVLIVIDNRPVGVLALADEPRPGARSLIEQLRLLGVRRTIMLTGDNPRAAAAVAESVGVDEFQAGLLPEHKLEQIHQLDQACGSVAMVGDGVNDAPALAAATVGIAVGGASGGGSDVALETADVALLGRDLSNLPEAIGMSRFTRRVITQNLVLAMGVIAVVAPLAALGHTTMYAAVMLHEGSTVLVVVNALRILAYRYRPAA